MRGIAGNVLALGFCLGLNWTTVLAQTAMSAPVHESLEQRLNVIFTKGGGPIDHGGTIRINDLEAYRPEPVGQRRKEAILRLLPAGGDVINLTASQRRKLLALDPVLDVHQRQGVYEIKIIDIPQAWTGLHERAILLISLPAIRLLSTEELQALVAHELGHEYLWDEFEAAQSQGQVQRLRSLEADCDAIATLTIARLGQRPERLIKALEKVFKYNHDRFGVALNQNRYPSLTERRASVMRLMEQFDR